MRRTCPRPTKQVSGLAEDSNWAYTYVHDEFLPLLTQHHTSLTPREVVHLPERVQRQPERERRNREDVEDHPSDHVPLASEYEDEGLEAVDTSDHDESQLWYLFAFSGNNIDEITNLEGREGSLRSPLNVHLSKGHSHIRRRQAGRLSKASR